MAKTKRKTKRPDGFHVTKKGYLRGWFGKRARLIHNVVWEQLHGPIPPGWQIHHINGDKQDNRPENLRAVTPTEHKRIHGGCELRDGVWWKPCKVCGEHKPIGTADWYLTPKGWPLYRKCKPCHIAYVVKTKRLRKARRKLSQTQFSQ